MGDKETETTISKELEKELGNRLHDAFARRRKIESEVASIKAEIAQINTELFAAGLGDATGRCW